MQRRGGVRRVAPWPSTTVPFAPTRAACLCGQVHGVSQMGSCPRLGARGRRWCDPTAPGRKRPN
eukprot:1902704-Prymnesium_polylepis.2